MYLVLIRARSNKKCLAEFPILKEDVIWQLEVCDHSQLVSQGHTKQIGLPFRSAPSFSQTVSVLAMRSPRDDLLKAEQHQSHVCYCPLESQLLLKHQSRPGMVI